MSIDGTSQDSTRPYYVMRRIFEEGFAAGDASVVDELCAPDLVEHQFGLAATGAQAREHVKAAIRDVHRAVPDISFAIEDYAKQGDKIWVRVRAASPPPGGQVQPVLPEQPRRAGGAADHRPQRRKVRQRGALVDNVHLSSLPARRGQGDQPGRGGRGRGSHEPSPFGMRVSLFPSLWVSGTGRGHGPWWPTWASFVPSW
jgi:hypothetical protein